MARFSTDAIAMEYPVPSSRKWSALPNRRNVLALAATGVAAANLPAAAAAAVPLGAQIDRFAANAMKQAPFPGLSIAVERKGTVLYRKAYGFADVENGVPVKRETVFPIGSITKTMTGLAITQLLMRGKIDLNATAGQYLPDLPKPAHDIKVRNLLDHTSGLVNYTDIPDFPHDSQKPFTRQEILGWFASRPLLFEPGTEWSYTNSGIYLLGLIIEKVTGDTYEHYLQKNIFAPFGMKNTSLSGWKPIVKNRARGYLVGADGVENAPRYDPLVAFSAGCVMSTIDDMLRYRRGVFGDGPTSAEIREHLLARDKFPDGTLLPYSLGCLTMADFEGHRRIGHPGDIYGFSAQYSYYPDDGVTILVMTNMQNGALPPISFEQKVARAVLGLPQPRIVDAALPSDAAARFVGTYKIGRIRFAFDTLGFVIKDNALCVGFDGSEAEGHVVRLKYQGGGEFVSTLDDEQKFRFGNGTVTMEFYGGAFEATKTSHQE